MNGTIPSNDSRFTIRLDMQIAKCISFELNARNGHDEQVIESKCHADMNEFGRKLALGFVQYVRARACVCV